MNCNYETEKKRPLGRPKNRCKYNNKMDLRENYSRGVI
jgi:hypothetical protein